MSGALTPTIERLAQSAFDEFDLDGEVGHDVLQSAADGEVTSMTTDLFALVTEDNALAFLDFEGDADPDPFTCLRGAIVQAVAARLDELVTEAVEKRMDEEG